MYDYKERQPRVNHLLKLLRSRDPSEVLSRQDRFRGSEPHELVLTAGQAIKEIEEGTLDGLTIVATAGFILQASGV